MASHVAIDVDLIYHVAMLRVAIVCVLGLLMTGCIGIQKPEVEVTAIRLDEVSNVGGRVLVDLVVTNPNDEELPMPTVSYSVDVIGAGSFEFTDRPYAALPKNGQVKLTLPAAVAGIGLKGKEVKVNGELIFEPQGELRRVFYDNYIPLPRSRFSGAGVLE